MKRLMTFAALTLLSGVVLGQQQKSFDDEVNNELDHMYDQQGTRAAPTTVPRGGTQVEVNVQPIQAQTAPTVTQTAPVQVSQAPVLQNQPVQAQSQQAQPLVQVQKTTFVEAAPLTESKADKIRKAREEAEVQTEQKIVEKLEISRMEDEKRRAEVLFGDKFNTLANPPQAPVVVAQGPVVVAAPLEQKPVLAAAPIVVAEQQVKPADVKEDKKDDSNKIDRTTLHDEIRAALEESKPKEEKKERKNYVSLLGGMDDYNNNNIQSQYSLGIGYGQHVSDRFLVEGQFNYGDSHIRQIDGVYGYPRITDMQAYQALIEAKYEILGGVFRPLVGAAAAYTYRHYNDIQFGSADDTGYSNAIDLGLLIGADAEVSENVAIGIEARYMWNLANQSQENNGLQTGLNYSNYYNTPENMGYYNISLVARIGF